MRRVWCFEDSERDENFSCQQTSCASNKFVDDYDSLYKRSYVLCRQVIWISLTWGSKKYLPQGWGWVYLRFQPCFHLDSWTVQHSFLINIGVLNLLGRELWKCMSERISGITCKKKKKNFLEWGIRSLVSTNSLIVKYLYTFSFICA